MSRERDDIVRSIRSLMRQVHAVSKIVGAKSQVFEVKSQPAASMPVASAYLTAKQVTQITNSLIHSINSAGDLRDRRELEAQVMRSLNEAIEDWISINLSTIVEEVVEQQVARSENYRKREYA